MKDPRKVIITHIMTEKYAEIKEKQNVYVFQVDTDANKIDVKAAIESLFNVKVEKVRTMNMRGKMKRLGRFTGKRPNWKKAVVNLATGETITQLDAV
jgi:large subunit ribosomal protein L23